jgi:hypothetical protein
VPRFVAAVHVEAPAERVWPLVVDWPSHGRWVPLTSIRVLTASPAGVGARFVARTGLGPIGFDDLMEVVEWRPPAAAVPGRCALQKHGRVVLGLAVFEVSARPGGGSRVELDEDIELAPARLTRPFGALVAMVGRLGASRVLRVMAAEAERAERAGRG